MHTAGSGTLLGATQIRTRQVRPRRTSAANGKATLLTSERDHMPCG
jgi:hypothetical protein